MLTSIGRIVRPAAVGAALFGIYVYAAPEQAQLARSTVLAATGSAGAAAKVANDCERASACRASAATGRIFDGGDSVLDVLAGGSMPKSICLLQDAMGEAAAAGDAMIARAYNGGVVEDFGETAATAKN